VSDPSGEPPVLKIRKDAEREVRYHYSREERLALKQPPRKPSTRGGKRRAGLARFFRGGRTSLLPIALFVLAIVLVVRFVSRDRSASHLAGYDLRLRAYAYEDALLASVTATWRPRPAERVAEAIAATVRFSATDSGPASVVIESLGGGESVIRGRLPSTGGDRQVVADVAIGTASARLTTAVGTSAGKP